MVAVGEDLAERLARLYEARGDVDVTELIDELRGVLDDDGLAELIDADGRLRLDRGLPVHLSRYLDAIPDLAMMPVALDAAIEFTLRAFADSGVRSGVAVESLIADYPMLEQPIRAASLLSEALWSTTQVRADHAPVQALQLPADFGPPLPSGRPRYELRDLVGSGAQGSVYLAVDRHLSDVSKPAWVAIKLLRRQVAEGTGRERLIEEATRARRINHPNVVRVLDRGIADDGHDYIVYEYVEGTTLRGWLSDRAGSIGHAEAAAMVAKIARGVQAAHSVNVVHCDIKPDNILVTRSGEPKVADFGVAVRLEEEEAASPRSDQGPVGNLAFISPEQFHLDEGAIAPPADIYACGGLLYYLLTGSPPNGRSVDEVERNFDRAAGRPAPPSLRTERTDTQPDLDAICARALARTPAERYSSAEGLAFDLESWLRHEPIAWTRPSPYRRLRLLCRRQPLAVVMLLAVFLTAILGTGLAVNLNHRAERRLMQERVAAADRLKFETEEYRVRMLASSKSMMTLIETRGASSLANNWITMMTIMEAVVGPKLIGEADEWKRLWTRRIELMQEYVNEGLATGRPPTFETRAWETLLGMFLLREDRLDEADAVFAANHQRWSEVLEPDDPWLVYVELMQSCSVIRRAVLSLDSGKPDAKTLATVKAAAAKLNAHSGLFKTRRAGDAVHRLVLENLMDAYGPDLLNDRAARRVAEEAYKRATE